MTIKLIDDALNIAIAGLMYGSEIWLTGAFVLYVLRARERKLRKASSAILRPGITITIQPSETPIEAPIKTSVAGPIEASSEEQTLEALPLEFSEFVLGAQPVVEGIQSIEDTQPTVKAQPVVKESAEKRVSITPQVTETVIAIPPLVVSQKAASKKAVSKTKTVPPVIVRPKIVCEPVDWKRWKVGDLRKASTYKACGVRIRPIGSRRNLPKMDLIAQYEQNLKRLTKKPPLLTVKHDKTA